jgi:hypothetical protein
MHSNTPSQLLTLPPPPAPFSDPQVQTQDYFGLFLCRQQALPWSYQKGVLYIFFGPCRTVLRRLPPCCKHIFLCGGGWWGGGGELTSGALIPLSDTCFSHLYKCTMLVHPPHWKAMLYCTSRPRDLNESK